MQSSLFVWTPTKSSSAVNLVNEDLSAANDNFVTRRFLASSSDEEGAGEVSSGDLAAMQACYVQLKQLVPSVPLNVELSSLQLLQHVIDYIGDLELALHSSAASPTQRPQHHQQHPETAACRSQTTTTSTQCNGQRQSVSTATSAGRPNTSSSYDHCSTTSDNDLSHNTSPVPRPTRTLCDTELLPSSHI